MYRGGNRRLPVPDHMLTPAARWARKMRDSMSAEEREAFNAKERARRKAKRLKLQQAKQAEAHRQLDQAGMSINFENT